MPSRNGIVGSQPSARILVTSKSLRGVPSGFVLSQTSSPSKPITSQTNSANSRIVTLEHQKTGRRKIVHVQKFTARLSGSPNDKLFLISLLRFVRLSQ